MSCGIPSAEPLITASALTRTATAHHINVSFDRTLTAERVFSVRGSASVFSSHCVHVSVCACTSHHSESSNHTCVCGEPASVEKKSTVHAAGNRMRSTGEKQPDKSSFCLTCKLGSELPAEGGEERQERYNMCIRPHNIIYNRQTHFHTNGFHHRGSPISITGERL